MMEDPHDSDFALALHLQQQIESENSPSTQRNIHATHRDLSIVDPYWETADPTPDIRAMFLEFNIRFFWGKLDSCEVRWSPRMTSCAGICCYEGFGGLCSIRLSQPLLKLRPRKDLVETLLHEMIHAFLFVTQNNKDHDGHGPEFHKHMYRLNQQNGTNISVYHTFHDEVANYQQHWWQCDGPCQKKPPYFGLVKRASNRAPSKNDFWWKEHSLTCGGVYRKIKEPEGYGEKKSKEKKSPVKPKGVPDIRSMFTNKTSGTMEKQSVPNTSSNSAIVSGNLTVHNNKTITKPVNKTNTKSNIVGFNGPIKPPTNKFGISNAGIVSGILNKPSSGSNSERSTGTNSRITTPAVSDSVLKGNKTNAKSTIVGFNGPIKPPTNKFGISSGGRNTSTNNRITTSSASDSSGPKVPKSCGSTNQKTENGSTLSTAASVSTPASNSDVTTSIASKSWWADTSSKVTKPSINRISATSTEGTYQNIAFSGTGQILGGQIGNQGSNCNSHANSQVIVRRIPGIGIITNERPTRSSTMTKSSISKECASDSESSIITDSEASLPRTIANVTISSTPFTSELKSDDGKSKMTTNREIKIPEIPSSPQLSVLSPPISFQSPRANRPSLAEMIEERRRHYSSPLNSKVECRKKNEDNQNKQGQQEDSKCNTQHGLGSSLQHEASLPRTIANVPTSSTPFTSELKSDDGKSKMTTNREIKIPEIPSSPQLSVLSPPISFQSPRANRPSLAEMIAERRRHYSSPLNSKVECREKIEDNQNKQGQQEDSKCNTQHGLGSHQEADSESRFAKVRSKEQSSDRNNRTHLIVQSPPFSIQSSQSRRPSLTEVISERKRQWSGELMNAEPKKSKIGMKILSDNSTSTSESETEFGRSRLAANRDNQGTPKLKNKTKVNVLSPAVSVLSPNTDRPSLAAIVAERNKQYSGPRNQQPAQGQNNILTNGDLQLTPDTSSQTGTRPSLHNFTNDKNLMDMNQFSNTSSGNVSSPKASSLRTTLFKSPRASTSSNSMVSPQASRNKSNTKTGPRAKKNKTAKKRHNFNPYISSDDDDADILFDLSNSSIKEKDIPDSPIGKKTKRNKKRLSVCLKSPENTKRVYGPKVAKFQTPTKNVWANRSLVSLSADRNKRGLALDTSDEDTDDEENKSIGSVLKKASGKGSPCPINIGTFNKRINLDESSSEDDSPKKKAALTFPTSSCINVDPSSPVKMATSNSPHKSNGTTSFSQIDPTVDDLDESQFSAFNRKSRYVVIKKKRTPLSPVKPSVGSNFLGKLNITRANPYPSSTATKRTYISDSSDSDTGKICPKKSRIDSINGATNTSTGAIGDVGNCASQSSSSSSLYDPFGTSKSNPACTSSAVGSTGSSFTISATDSDPLQDCPSCTERVRASQMNDHLDVCLALPDLF